MSSDRAMTVIDHLRVDSAIQALEQRCCMILSSTAYVANNALPSDQALRFLRYMFQGPFGRILPGIDQYVQTRQSP